MALFGSRLLWGRFAGQAARRTIGASVGKWIWGWPGTAIDVGSSAGLYLQKKRGYRAIPSALQPYVKWAATDLGTRNLGFPGRLVGLGGRRPEEIAREHQALIAARQTRASSRALGERIAQRGKELIESALGRALRGLPQKQAVEFATGRGLYPRVRTTPPTIREALAGGYPRNIPKIAGKYFDVARYDPTQLARPGRWEKARLAALDLEKRRKVPKVMAKAQLPPKPRDWMRVIV